MKYVERFKIWISISLVIMLIGLFVAVTKGFNMGIDFTGGTSIEINLHKYVSSEELSEIIHKYDSTASVDYLGQNKEIIQINTTKNMDEQERVKLFDEYKKQFDLKDSDYIKSGYIGASIGSEIQKKAILSVVIAGIAMLIYISFRFKFSFGASAIIALLHDVLIVLSIYAIFQIPINSPFVAAILTVVGYSINDTIVVFDRIRENKKIMKRSTIEEIADASISQTITRSLNTSITTLLSIAALYIMGVDAIKEFTFPLIAGVAVGTYSSIFIASPLWVRLSKKLDNKKKIKVK